MTAFKLREIDDKSSNTDFKSIFNHITKEYNEVADIKQMNIQTETKENKSIQTNHCQFLMSNFHRIEEVMKRQKKQKHFSSFQSKMSTQEEEKKTKIGSLMFYILQRETSLSTK